MSRRNLRPHSQTNPPFAASDGRERQRESRPPISSSSPPFFRLAARRRPLLPAALNAAAPLLRRHRPRIPRPLLPPSLPLLLLSVRRASFLVLVLVCAAIVLLVLGWLRFGVCAAGDGVGWCGGCGRGFGRGIVVCVGCRWWCGGWGGGCGGGRSGLDDICTRGAFLSLRFP